MTVIIGTLKNNRIVGRSVYESYESAAEVLQPGTFIQETEETGPLQYASLWDGEKLIPPTEQEIAELDALLSAEVNNPIE